jgi:hypothetical protein
MEQSFDRRRPFEAGKFAVAGTEVFVDRAQRLGLLLDAVDVSHRRHRARQVWVARAAQATEIEPSAYGLTSVTADV